MSILISIYYLLMCAYFRFASNAQIAVITYKDVVSGSCYFIIQSFLFISFAFYLTRKLKNSIDILSMYTFIMYNLLLILREIYIIIVGAESYDYVINSWQASISLTIFCLLLNILLLIVKWKR